MSEKQKTTLELAYDAAIIAEGEARRAGDQLVAGKLAEIVAALRQLVKGKQARREA
jgi:hypothetical protein